MAKTTIPKNGGFFIVMNPMVFRIRKKTHQLNKYPSDGVRKDFFVDHLEANRIPGIYKRESMIFRISIGMIFR